MTYKGWYAIKQRNQTKPNYWYYVTLYNLFHSHRRLKFIFLVMSGTRHPAGRKTRPIQGHRKFFAQQSTSKCNFNLSPCLRMIPLCAAYWLKFLTSFGSDLQAFFDERRDMHSTYHSDSLVTYTVLKNVVRHFCGKHLHQITAISISKRCG